MREDKKEGYIQRNIATLHREASVFYTHTGVKYAILSDMHLGDGGKTDDFAQNGDLCQYVLEQYYLKNGYTLILNGDIEELQRSRLIKIKHRWSGFFDLLQRFYREDKLIKIVGNHDFLLHGPEGNDYPFPLHRAVSLRHEGGEIFLFHGHQASMFFEKFNRLSGAFLKYVANPLRIKNLSVAHDSVKRYKVEKRAYEFAAENKCIVIIGHTHRPLFESLSKLDSLRFTIEQLCRNYPSMSKKEQEFAESIIRDTKREIDDFYDNRMWRGQEPSLYNARILVPCLFNSGCTIGKRGITSIEVEEDKIRLVHWFDKNAERKQQGKDEFKPEELGTSGYFRMLLKQDYLSYIFTRISLLT